MWWAAESAALYHGIAEGLRRYRGIVDRYGIACVVVAGATGLKVIAEPALGEESPFLLYLAAVLLSSLYGGIGPGLITCASATAISAYFFFPPYYSFQIADPHVRLRLVTFFLEAVFITVVGGRLRTAHQRAQARRQAAEALSSVSHTLAETLDETVVASRIVNSVGPLFNVHSAVLRRLRSDGALVALAISGPAREHFTPGHVLPPGAGISGRAIVERRAIAGEELGDADVALTDDLRRIEDAGTHGVLAVPLIVQGEPLGTLALGDWGPRKFSDAEVVLLESFADQAALALHNAQVLNTAKIRRAQLEALLEITHELSAIERVDTLLEKIAEICGRLLGSGSVGFRLLDGDDLVMMGNFGDASQIMRKARLKVGESVSGVVAATGEPLIVSNLEADPHVIEEHRVTAVQAGYKQWLGVPAKLGGRVVGVFSIRTRREEGFSESDVAIATAFAAQAGLALERVRLYAEADRRRQTAERLAEIGRLLSQSLDLREVAQRVVTHLRSLVPALRTALYRTEPTSEALLLVAESMEAGIDIAGNEGFARGEGVPGLAFVERRLVVTPDLLTDARVRLSPALRAYWTNTPVRAVAAVPLVGADSMLGVLIIADREGRVFTDDELRTLELFAGQASVAIGNARLYQHTQEAFRELSEAQTQLLQAGKLAAVGQLVAGVAHELNNPLTVVVGHADLLSHVTDPLVAARADQILRSASRAARIIKELQTFARPQPVKRTVVNLVEILDRVLTLRQQTLEVSGVHVERHVSATLSPVNGDALQLEQVVLNLVLNAEQAVLEPQRLARIVLKIEQHRDQVSLSISDNGSGIAADILPRIFEPFFTTKPVGRGTGLGLSICYRIVEAHGGRIWAQSEPGKGATFFVELPAMVTAQFAQSATASSPATGTVRAGRVLVIDDEKDVADPLRVLFETQSQHVTVATSAEQGWDLLTAPGAAYDLVTVDIKMPHVSGPQLWKRLVAAGSPFVNRIAFVTGDTADPETDRFLRETRRPVLTKPLDSQDLIRLLTPAPIPR